MGRRILIMGAAGRDFHNFNVVYREDPTVDVVAFTATQIPFIDRRTYPKQLAGTRYPRGIPIHPEEELPQLIRDLSVDEVVFAYSDVSHEHVMHRASIVLAAGADFTLLGPESTMLAADVPVVAVCASRTGAGKSQTSRAVARVLHAADLRTVAIRHPMPYGELCDERVQRFASTADLDEAGVTIEEREEYEPHIAAGTVVFAGVDYGAILAEAEEEADVIIWDGGNNDLPFIRPTLHITVVDPLRPGDELRYHPGETNVRMADVIVVNKMDVADLASNEQVLRTVHDVNPRARIVMARSPLAVDEFDAIRGKRVLVVEDGPTLTHGNMKFGAGVVAAQQLGAAEIVDPRPYAVGTLEDVYRRYDVGRVLPAMGYSPEQLSEMEKTIADCPCDLVVIATPIDLRHVVPIAKPAVRVTYELQVAGSPSLADVLAPIVEAAKG